VVLNEHNIEYEIFHRMTATERSLHRRLFNAAEYVKYRPFERRWWQRAAACAIPSEREAEIVRRRAPRTPIAVVPNGVDSDYFTPGAAPIEPDTIVFTGLLSYRPNLDAARYIVEEILPLVRRRHPGVTLTIVGDGDPPDFESLRRPGVVVTERVPDLRPYVRRAAVSVAPIRMGGGTRLKVLEALAMGKSVVTTPLGSEGLAVRDREHLAVVDGPAEAFASRVVEVLDHPETAAAMGERGRALVLAKYSWEQATARLEDLHRQAILSPLGCAPQARPSRVG
jgi:glycosyltransferase involved in cell wall biosynthesis